MKLRVQSVFEEGMLSTIFTCTGIGTCMWDGERWSVCVCSELRRSNCVVIQKKN